MTVNYFIQAYKRLDQSMPPLRFLDGRSRLILRLNVHPDSLRARDTDVGRVAFMSVDGSE